jgi:hypothetical protein
MTPKPEHRISSLEPRATHLEASMPTKDDISQLRKDQAEYNDLLCQILARLPEQPE